jgi:imidazolonepropionase-like amidohydrolase
MEQAFPFLRTESQKEAAQEKTEPVKTELGFEHPTAKPESTIAFLGAKIITMGEQGVIENGTIVIENNRILAVGKKREVEIPEGATKVKVPGMVIMPGFIDTHAHGPAETDGIQPEANWVNYARLAFGVTTISE